jgi:hypothetical protein
LPACLLSVFVMARMRHTQQGLAQVSYIHARKNTAMD